VGAVGSAVGLEACSSARAIPSSWSAAEVSVMVVVDVDGVRH
jgi:hypothetical protein